MSNCTPTGLVRGTHSSIGQTNKPPRDNLKDTAMEKTEWGTEGVHTKQSPDIIVFSDVF